MSVYLWHQAERVGEPTDTEEVGRVEWVPLARVPELARCGELLGSGALVPLPYYLATRDPQPTSITPVAPRSFVQQGAPLRPPPTLPEGMNRRREGGWYASLVGIYVRSRAVLVAVP